jgi:hypothetical protein
MWLTYPIGSIGNRPLPPIHVCIENQLALFHVGIPYASSAVSFAAFNASGKRLPYIK